MILENVTIFGVRVFFGLVILIVSVLKERVVFGNRRVVIVVKIGGNFYFFIFSRSYVEVKLYILSRLGN